MQLLKKAKDAAVNCVTCAWGKAKQAPLGTAAALAMVLTLFVGGADAQVTEETITPPVELDGYILGLATELGYYWIAIIGAFFGFLALSIGLRKSKKIGSA